MTIEQQSSPHPLTRSAASAASAGGIVVGWSPGRLAWVTDGSAGSTARDLHAVPHLDGTLELPAASESFSEDFGHLVHQDPQSVLRPGSVDDIVKIVRYARECGVKVAMNGQGGQDGQRESHSLYGQALVDGGIAIDSKCLDAIHGIGDGFADVDAGVRWSSLVTAAARSNQTAPVVNDFPYLSIGGTLAIGGMGPTSHLYGSQADNVEELQVVTGRGELVTCSRSRHRDLFDAVLAGAGQYGLIVRATVKLIPAPAMVSALRLVYDDRQAYLRDVIAVMQSGHADDLNGGPIPNGNGGWRYLLVAGMYHTPPAAPPEQALLDMLSPGATVQERLEMPYYDWLFKLDPMWKQLKDSGHWDQAKPRFTVFVSADRAADVAETVLSDITADDLGAGSVRLSPVNPATVKAPMFVMPSRTDPAIELSIGRFPPPDHPDIPGLLAQNRRIYDAAVAAGGKRYLYGAIPNMTPEDWRRHYGTQWSVVKTLKSHFDPDNVLTPGQRIFG